MKDFLYNPKIQAFRREIVKTGRLIMNDSHMQSTEIFHKPELEFLMSILMMRRNEGDCTKWSTRNKRVREGVVVRKQSKISGPKGTHQEEGLQVKQNKRNLHISRQVTPKTSHLNAVKRIFKYLKGKPHLGLWYPRESPFDLEAFSDSDYGGSNLDRKSTTGGSQFLGQRLISWQWFAEIVDFLRGSNLRYALTANPTIYDSLVKQFWQSAIANTKADGSLEINATIDTIRYTISEASIRDSLQLDDATGITMLPNDDLFEGMGQIGKQHPYLAVSLTKKIFGNMKRGFQGAPRPLLPSMLLVATNPNAGQEHAAQAQSQPSSSSPQAPPPPHIPTPTPPPIPTPTPPPITTSTPPITTSTPPPIPTPTPPPITTPTPPPIPSPTPIPDNEPTQDEHIYEEQSPVHHHFSPPQE
ncbi:hypothetical protein Tco_1016257 [Tanacetum coccineum]|uniref:Uncharacterized protein n=1 Tax=Tanacetum coccineum TaxID=301880 RepID=A0ABQ5FQJ9_9ASTR